MIRMNLIGMVVNEIERINNNFDETLNYVHEFAFAAGLQHNDVYTFKHALQQDDREDFLQAAIKEIDDHEKRGHWELVPRTSIPKEAKTILSIWSFKRKRYPDGRILKHKARICAHGDMQQWGQIYWETYSPVVSWLSIRTLLTLSKILELDTKSIDFVLAFPQADLDVDIFMELPSGFEVANNIGGVRYILRLKKNLYGLKQAGLNWFDKLRKGLEDRGFVQSKIDPCVFMRHDCIIVTYVDDCIMFVKDIKVADTLVKSLQEGPEKFDFTDEGSVHNYLGVEIIDRPDIHKKAFEMKQPYLIERILETVQIDSKTNVKDTPVTKPLLTKDKSGEERRNNWNYRSVIGMLNYLQGTTRPDISMPVHQCARFNNDPKLSHERAVKRICKYLLGSKGRGCICIPDFSKGIQCFVDADFVGCWTPEEACNPENVLSRTGYIIFYAGCPLIWCSKLQTEIALSTTEAEYIALSQALRQVIPLLYFMDEITKIFKTSLPKPQIHCKVFEDNESCIAVAKSKKFTPRTKHIALKYHHFRRFVDKGVIEICSIDTTKQTADALTKPLCRDLFVFHRTRMIGW